MAGRLQKAAAILIVVSAAGRPVSAASLLDISGASAFAGDARRPGLAFDWRVFGVETRFEATLRYAPTPWLSLDLDAALQRARFADGLLKPIPGAARRYGQAGATLRPGGGWNASVFVTSFGARPSTDDDPARVRSASFVSGRITRYLSKTTRVSLDIVNLLDKRFGNLDHFSATRLWSYPGAADNFLFYPGESRAFRLRLRSTF